MQVAEGLGIVLGGSAPASGRCVEILVDDDAGAVAECRRLLDRRLDIKVAVPVEFQVGSSGAQWRMPMKKKFEWRLKR